MKKKIGIGVVVLLVVIQFIRIDKTNPTVEVAKDFITINQPPNEVKSILKNSCYDCHSFESKYPWYSNIAPISWVIKNHIEQGRKHLNFSAFEDYNSDQKKHVLEECVEVIEDGEMPMKGYTVFHAGTSLSETDKTKLIAYFKSAINK